MICDGQTDGRTDRQTDARGKTMSPDPVGGDIIISQNGHIQTAVPDYLTEWPHTDYSIRLSHRMVTYRLQYQIISQNGHKQTAVLDYLTAWSDTDCSTRLFHRMVTYRLQYQIIS